jgi:hypothetical protein
VPQDTTSRGAEPAAWGWSSGAWCWELPSPLAGVQGLSTGHGLQKHQPVGLEGGGRLRREGGQAAGPSPEEVTEVLRGFSLLLTQPSLAGHPASLLGLPSCPRLNDERPWPGSSSSLTLPSNASDSSGVTALCDSLIPTFQ